MIAFSCPACGKKLGGKDEYAGRRMKCPACGVPLTVPSGQPSAPHREATAVAEAPRPAGPDSSAPAATTTKYDRFTNLTSISTTERPDGLEGVWVIARARFEGTDLSKAAPTYSLLVAVWTNGRVNDLFTGKQLILRADGAPIKLELDDPGEPVMVAVIDRSALRTLATAKAVEGQIDGHYDFKLTSAQIRRIAELYRQVAQG